MFKNKKKLRLSTIMSIGGLPDLNVNQGPLP